MNVSGKIATAPSTASVDSSGRWGGGSRPSGGSPQGCLDAVGNPNGDAWRYPSPDRLVAIAPQQLTFQSAFLAIGFSGGGLLDDLARLAGMIVRDEPPSGSAVPLGAVLALVSAWGYPVQLRPALPGAATPLHQAAAAGDMATLKAGLSEACADPNMRDGAQATPLHYAAQAGQLDAARFLLQSGANVKAKASTLFERAPYVGPGYTALHIAAWQSDLELVKLLVAAGADVNAKNKLGITPLRFVPTRHASQELVRTQLEIVRLLIKSGADVNAAGRDDDDALNHAVRLGSREIAAALIQAHADVNRAGWGGDTPLALAIDAGDEELVTMLLAAGADANTGAALSRALRKKKEAIVTRLLRSGARLETAGSIDALQEAIRERWRDVTRLLIERGVDVNALRETQVVADHGTAGGSPRVRPLDVAVENRDIEIVRLLLAAKANVNLPDEEKRTALHHAACKAVATVLGLLLDAGARVNAETFFGKTALDEALACQNAEAARYLRQRGGTRGAGQVGGKY